MSDDTRYLYTGLWISVLLLYLLAVFNSFHVFFAGQPDFAGRIRIDQCPFRRGFADAAKKHEQSR